MFIEQPSIWLRWLWPHGLWRMNKHERAVYLTFDDGPIPEVTPRVLDILDKYGIKATFFMVGDNARKYPDIYKMVVDRGHRIGNHTFNHLSGIIHGSIRYIDNVKKANEYLHTDLIRPPYGWMKWEQYLFLHRNYKLVMWDLVTRDYSKRVDAHQIFNNVRRYARPGSIITFHDSLKTAEKLWVALPQCIEWLQSQGYQFKVFKKYH